MLGLLSLFDDNTGKKEALSTANYLCDIFYSFIKIGFPFSWGVGVVGVVCELCIMEIKR